MFLLTVLGKIDNIVCKETSIIIFTDFWMLLRPFKIIPALNVAYLLQEK